MQIFLLLTLLAVLPGALLMVTGFTRILIVLGFLRNALGTPTIPPNQVLVGHLAVPLAVRDGADAEAGQRRSPSSRTRTSEIDAADRRSTAARSRCATFMFKQTRDSDLALFVQMADLPAAQDARRHPDLRARSRRS